MDFSNGFALRSRRNTDTIGPTVPYSARTQTRMDESMNQWKDRIHSFESIERISETSWNRTEQLSLAPIHPSWLFFVTFCGEKENEKSPETR
mmetsp:Transcript_21516/g.50960  ORF Transcript_21516/g.50960 Transcript_21516/m.50960 type:complete len:92 (+) Transcript_21516:83-358(+)